MILKMNVWKESPSGQSSCQELGTVKKSEGTVVGYHRERRTIEIDIKMLYRGHNGKGL